MNALSQFRHTKIVATLGPASCKPETIGDLIAAGVDMFRLNASHGDHEFFAEMVNHIRAASRDQGREVAVLMDLRGPKIRVGALTNDEPVELKVGAELRITTRSVEGTPECIPCTYAGLPHDVEAGDQILLDDGLMELEVLRVEQLAEVVCRVVVGGMLKPNKGINVPGRALSARAFDEKDLRDLDSAISLDVDWVALSFVRRPEDVRQLRDEMQNRGGRIPIIAKIEKPQAIDAIDQILAASDGIMVARGDLGVEVEPERVPTLQKMLIHKANEWGVPVITATQMLESMIENNRPTRAEASDVANAILDGTDAVMLSGETAAGKHPLAAVRIMGRIAQQVEESSFYRKRREETPELARFSPETRAVARAAREVARSTVHETIVIYTMSGTTALVQSKLLASGRLVVLCPDPRVCRRMSLYRGALPLFSEFYSSTDELLRAGDIQLLNHRVAQPGETVVVIGGTMQFAGATNMLQLRVVGLADVAEE